MSTDSPRQPDGDDRLNGDFDRFLAGDMSPAERVAFETRCASDPALAEALRAHRAVGRALARLFVVPALIAPNLDEPPTEGPTTPHDSTSIPTDVGAAASGLTGAATGLSGLVIAGWIAAGAALLIGLFVGVRALTGGQAALADPIALLTGAGGVVFAASESQTDPSLLSVLLSDKLGRRISVAGAPGVEYLGVRSVSGGSPVRIAVLARVDGRPALVVLDLRGSSHSDDAATPPAGMRRHSASIGALQATEWSVREVPAILPRITAD